MITISKGTKAQKACETAINSLKMNIALDCENVIKRYNKTVTIDEQSLENCISHICVNQEDNDEEIYFQWQLAVHMTEQNSTNDKNCDIYIAIVSGETLLIIILIAIVIGRWIKDSKEKREKVLQARRRMATLDDFLSPVQRGQMDATQTIEDNNDENDNRTMSQIPNNRKSSNEEIVAGNIPSRDRPLLKELNRSLERDRQESLPSMSYPPQGNPDMTTAFDTLNRRIQDEKCNRNQTPPFRPPPIRIRLSALELPKLDSATHNYDAIESLTSGLDQSNDNDDDSIYYNTFGKSRSQLTSSIEYIAREQHSPDD